MKAISNQDMNKVNKVLSAAYHEKENIEVDELWSARVMDRIQSLGSQYTNMDYVGFFQQFVWKIAPVACVLVLLLGVALAQIDFVSDYELTKMFIEDPTELSLMTLVDGGWG